MARTTSWKGYLKLSLVSCAVAMAPAQTGTEKVSFNNLNRATGHRLRQQLYDSVTGDVVDREDLVRGYEYEKGRYIFVEDEDLDAVALESRHTIDIDQFVDAKELDRLYMGDSHYLLPDDEVAVEAYSVIREAMERAGVAGIARLTVNHRERWVAVQPRGKGILLTTLKYPYEVRDQRIVFDKIDDGMPDPKSIEAAEAILDTMAGEFDPSTFNDRYQEAVQKMLKEKQAGATVKVSHVGTPEAPGETRVVNLLDTLRKAIEAEKAERRPKAASMARGRAKNKRSAA